MTNLTDVDVLVTYADGPAKGKSERIMLRKLPAGPFRRWCAYLGDDRMDLLVEVAAGRDRDWVDTLDDKSFDRLVVESVKQNFHRAMTVSEDNPFIAGKILPVLLRMRQIIASIASSGILIEPSQPPQCSAAAAGTPPVS